MKNKESKRVYEKILSVFAWFVFALAIITSILSITASLSGQNNGEKVFGYKILIVASDSMSKSNISENEDIYFDSGDLIIIKTTENGAEFKEGEVISFISRNPESYGKTLTHKIRQVNYSASGKLLSYTTYGINTGVSDSVVVSPDMVIGSYVAKIPSLGTVFSYLKTPAGYYLSILAPSIFLIIFFSIRLGKFLGKKENAIELNAQGVELNAQGVEQNAQKVEQNALDILALSKRLSVLESMITNLNEFKLLDASQIDKTIETEKSVEERVDEISVTEEILESQDNKFKQFNAKRLTFIEKLKSLDEFAKERFNEIRNELRSYKGVRERVSVKGITYRIKKKLLAKITVCGMTLKLHLALNVNDFNEKVYFQKDLSSVKAYEEVPFTVKIKSQRAQSNAIKLITELMQKNGVVKDEKFVKVNAINTLLSLSGQELLQDKIVKEEILQEEIIDLTAEDNAFKSKFANVTKKSFSQKLLSLDQSVQTHFNIIHEELTSFKRVKYRISFKHVSYRLGRRLLAKFTIRGKTLKLHLALSVSEFNKNVYFQKDLSSVKAYEEVPFTVKIKSQRAQKNAIKLIQVLMKENQAIQINDSNK